MSAPRAPLVSVCIANYNGETMLAECVDSVLAQRRSLDIELIVHDDASTDGSVSLLRLRYPEARIIQSPDNVGFCVANNRMAEIARGRYLLLLNNDAALFPDAVDCLLRAAEALTCPSVLTLPQHDWHSNELVDRGCMLDPFYTPIPNTSLTRSDVAYVIGACLWIDRALWKQLGGFPDWLGSIAEDLYLGCVARLTGHPVRCLSTSGYRHRQGASFGGNRINGGTLSSNYRRRYLSERNRLAVLITCTPAPLAGFWLIAHLLSLAVECVVVILTQRSMRPFHDLYGAAVVDVWKWRSLLFRQRRRIAATRRISVLTYLRGFVPIPRKLQLLLKHGFPTLR